MTMIKDSDHGTPARHSESMISVEIDGRPITVPEGTSIMRAASLAGVTIPRLCATEHLEPTGSCRLCLVEISGRKGTRTSCTTPVARGQKIITKSERLDKIRNGVMELYISDHPLDCVSCAANGDCELQDVSTAMGVNNIRYVPKHAHQDLKMDLGNPYFAYDPTKCITCNRCVRVCQDVQGTFALTVDGRGFESRITPGMGGKFMESNCVSCGACVQVCPTASLMEKTVIAKGIPERSVLTTCAFCGVGCSFRAEVKGNEVVRMVPHMDGGANEGHSCIKGRFAFGFATHSERQTKPLIREKITDPWREVSWDQAIAYTAAGFKRIKDQYGSDANGGITSSRTTNEDVYAVQKMIRGAFGSNNVDTCARVCHSPTGFGLSHAFGTSAGTQDFRSVDDCNVLLVIGANPTDAHPVFGSRMKKRIRSGAKIIVVDPRAIDLVESPHIRADYHLQLQPGTNVAILNALTHTIMDENLEDVAFIETHCDLIEFGMWKNFILDKRNSPEALEQATGVPADQVRAAARLYATGGNAAIYYGLGVTEHTQGSSTVMAIANLAMITGNIGRPGVGVNPLRGQNNVQGACDMGSFPHELPGYRHISDATVRHQFETAWGVILDPEPGLRIPNMFDAAIAGSYRGIFVHGEDIAHSDPNIQHVHKALALMDHVVVLDLFLNETAKFAHVFLPGTSYLEKDGTFTNAERRINRVRPAIEMMNGGKHEWQIVAEIATAMGFPMGWNSGAEVMDEIARLTPTFAYVSFKLLDERGSIQWPCNADNPDGSPIMHVHGFARGKGQLALTEYIPTDERTSRFYPLILTTGRILAHYNVGTQTRRTENMKWHDEDLLEINPHDAAERGIKDGDMASVASRMGATPLKVEVTGRVAPGIVYATFHHPESNANLITTDNSDWATNCPEYKVTAVQVTLGNQSLHDAAE
jgi:formate dehydrogenase major subunit